VTVDLTPDEQAMLDGGHGPGVAFAMRVVVALAEAQQAPRLVEVTAAHIDSCLYHGQASLDFVRRLGELGATVQVPTTLNVGSVDLVHPDVVRADGAERGELHTKGRELMEGYVQLGCTPTFTCAPYQLASRPQQGQRIAWAESNAIVFANSVIGAFTDRYGDFLDICAAVTGRVPYAGLQTPEARRGRLVFDCAEIGDDLDQLGWSVLGYVVGHRAGPLVPVLTGVTGAVPEDWLKAFGAAAASSGGVAMFHVVGVTPEAPSLDDALGGLPALDVVTVTREDIRSARAALSTVTSGPVHAVSIGTPHASLHECAELVRLLDAGPPVAPSVKFYLSMGRATAELLKASGQLATLEQAGVTIVSDTCTYVTSVLPDDVKVVMTNSGKWAHYAPANIGVDVVLGTLAECVASARCGQVALDAQR